MGVYVALRRMNLDGERIVAPDEEVPQDFIEQTDDMIVTKLVLAGEMYYVPAEDEVYDGPQADVPFGATGGVPHPSVTAAELRQLEEAGLAGVSPQDLAVLAGDSEGSVEGDGEGAESEAFVGEASDADPVLSAPDLLTTEPTDYDPADHSVKDVLAYAEGRSKEDLEGLVLAELEGKNRSSLVQKLEYRIEQMGTPEDE